MSTNLEVGIVGLPNVGKSTLFNAITKAGAEAANYPFCTIEPNVGVVDVPDKRLSVLGEMVKAKKIVPAAMRFVDIAGLVKGASKGEGLGNKFLAHIREVDAVAQVVRCFEDGNITHVEGSIDPLRDIEIINTELCLADMESVEKRQERLVKLLKTGDKKVPIEKAVLDKVLAGLSEAVPARRLGLTEDELEFLKELHLLTMKPVLYVANVSEEEVADASANPHVQAVVKYAAGEGAEVITVSAKMESEIADLPAGGHPAARRWRPEPRPAHSGEGSAARCRRGCCRGRRTRPRAPRRRSGARRRGTEARRRPFRAQRSGCCRWSSRRWW